MKALSVQQPFAFEILSGTKTIEVRSWDTLHRGDLLICSSTKPAFSREEMNEIEEEYGCRFRYGQALCVVRIADVRPMRPGDEEEAMVNEIDPDAFSWLIEDVRPVVPFPVKGRQGFFEVEDALIRLSPFKIDESVVVKEGTVAQDFGVDFSGWHGRVCDILQTEEGEPRIHVIWDSLTLRALPIPLIEACEKEGVDWTGVLLRFDEIQRAEPRDRWEDVQDTIEKIEEENAHLISRKG
ncbi:MAG: ASCH domain-containing protein [Syntrophobacteraceae bacterium]|nr:ASCH domain-containing protein [Syntrophobacteraceae bacterium]